MSPRLGELSPKPAKRRRVRRRTKRTDQLPSSLRAINLNAAGIDIGAESHFVAVPDDRDERSVREFGAFTVDLYAIADWLESCGIETVAMESTGVYWLPLLELLEERGFKVKLVDPHQLKNVPGRKSDVLDCQWIQQLHTFGLLSGAFRPDDQVCVLRSLMRQRGMLVSCAADHIRHMQKALTQMNVKLQHVVSDVTGKTGMGIIRAIVEGERDPHELAQLRDHRCRKSVETIAKALEGNWRVEHLFALRQAVELYDFYQQRIADCEREIEVHLGTFEDRSGGQPLPKMTAMDTPRKPKKHPFSFDAETVLYQMTGIDVVQIGGVAPTVSLQIISEIGLDMSKWQTTKRFASWLGLCPGSKISGGKMLSSRSRQCANRAAAAFRMAAYGVQHSACPLGAFYRRMKARMGPAQAITATAHKIARILFAMLRDGAEYIEHCPQEAAKNTERATRALKRNARRLGFKLVPLNDQPTAAAA